MRAKWTRYDVAVSEACIVCLCNPSALLNELQLLHFLLTH